MEQSPVSSQVTHPERPFTACMDSTSIIESIKMNIAIKFSSVQSKFKWTFTNVRSFVRSFCTFLLYVSFVRSFCTFLLYVLNFFWNHSKAFKSPITIMNNMSDHDGVVIPSISPATCTWLESVLALSDITTLSPSPNVPSISPLLTMPTSTINTNATNNIRATVLPTTESHQVPIQLKRKAYILSPVLFPHEMKKVNTTACKCASACKTLRCACVKNGKICAPSCSCTGCQNPLEAFNDLHLPIIMHACLLQNLSKLTDLKNLLFANVNVPCCSSIRPLHALLHQENYTCHDCSISFFFSWCWKRLVPIDQKAYPHCAICKRCSDHRHAHCLKCNHCYFTGVSNALSCTCMGPQIVRTSGASTNHMDSSTGPSSVKRDPEKPSDINCPLQ